MNLFIEIPKPAYCKTNDGSTARKFFEESSISSSATGIDEKTIKRFLIILKTISCGETVVTEAFKY